MKDLKHYQDLEARKHGYMTINEAEVELGGVLGDKELLANLKYDAQEKWATDNYPVQDDTWPSRRWKADMSEYVDLSGY